MIKIIGVPHFEIPVTMTDVDMLTGLSSTHYDGVCQAYSKLGGPVYGWGQQLEWSGEFVIRVQLTFRQVDTICKICEGLPRDEAIREWARHFVDPLRRALCAVSKRPYDHWCHTV